MAPQLSSIWHPGGSRCPTSATSSQDLAWFITMKVANSTKDVLCKCFHALLAGYCLLQVQHVKPLQVSPPAFFEGKLVERIPGWFGLSKLSPHPRRLPRHHDDDITLLGSVGSPTKSFHFYSVGSRSTKKNAMSNSWILYVLMLPRAKKLWKKKTKRTKNEPGIQD